MFGLLNRKAALPADVAEALAGAYDHHEMEQISRFGTVLRLGAGTTLATEGKPGREVFLILSGNADVLRDGEVIATVGPQDVVGEGSIFTNEPRNATLLATSHLNTVVFSRRDFNSVLAVCPALEARLRKLSTTRAA